MREIIETFPGKNLKFEKGSKKCVSLDVTGIILLHDILIPPELRTGTIELWKPTTSVCKPPCKRLAAFCGRYILRGSHNNGRFSCSPRTYIMGADSRPTTPKSILRRAVPSRPTDGSQRKRVTFEVSASLRGRPWCLFSRPGLRSNSVSSI